MRLKEDSRVRELIEQEEVDIFNEQRDDLRAHAKEQLSRFQAQNRKTFNKNRKDARLYCEGDLIAIRRTQFGFGLKLYPKFLGPYRIVTALRNDRYIVEKVGAHEGPQRTSAAADHMKPWVSDVGEKEKEEGTSVGNDNI